MQSAQSGPGTLLRGMAALLALCLLVPRAGAEVASSAPPEQISPAGPLRLRQVTGTADPKFTFTPTMTVPPSPTPTATPTPAATQAAFGLAVPVVHRLSEGPTTAPTETPAATLTDTVAPSATPSETITPQATPTASDTPTETPTLTMTATATPTPTGTPTPTFTLPPPTLAPGACADIIANGGCEADAGWAFPATGCAASYSSAAAHNLGGRSLRTGISMGTNTTCFSRAEQTLTIPSEALTLTLSLWYYARATGGAEDNDRHAVILVDGSGLPHDLLLLVGADAHQDLWREATFDESILSAYRGQTVTLRTETYNDGTNRLASMYVDDVQFSVCRGASTMTPTATRTVTPSATPLATPPPTASVTATPMPTPTLGPGGCLDLVVNGTAENVAGWAFPPTAMTAGYSTLQAHNPGGRALRTGIEAGGPVLSYSQADQALFLPTNADRITLSFWYYPMDTGTETDTDDYHRAVLLDEEGAPLVLLLLEGAAADQRAWLHATFDETLIGPLRGQEATLRFETFNDYEERSALMYVDDVQLTACDDPELTVPALSAASLPATDQKPHGH